MIIGATLVALYAWTAVDRALLFWSALIPTRPLGAAVGDLLDKPVDHCGVAFSRPLASAALAVAIVVLMLALPSQRARQPRRTPLSSRHARMIPTATSSKAAATNDR